MAQKKPRLNIMLSPDVAFWRTMGAATLALVGKGPEDYERLLERYGSGTVIAIDRDTGELFTQDGVPLKAPSAPATVPPPEPEAPPVPVEPEEHHAPARSAEPTKKVKGRGRGRR